MRLPPGWYPHSEEEIARVFQGLPRAGDEGAQAVISPHAGWFFSGRLAGTAFSALRRRAQTVVVAGGHLSAASPLLFAMEDAVHTPLGPLLIDTELRDAVIAACGGEPDTRADNTVEVLLPAVRFFFPDARLLWLRLPSSPAAFDAGLCIAQKAAELGRAAVCVASTDLTHYGPAYGFTPEGRGEAALEWVRSVNDRRFIDALCAADAGAVLERARRENSACSPGAALCALGFAGAPPEAAGGARLLAYGTSVDALRAAGERVLPDSFVGYAALVFCPRQIA
jgi:AmmeMemoRadiSam system protein B